MGENVKLPFFNADFIYFSGKAKIFQPGGCYAWQGGRYAPTVVLYGNFDHSLNAKKLLDLEDDDLDIALKKYDITRKTLEEMMANIREWYQKQPHLPQGQLHDHIIIGQLLTRGFSVEQAKEKIDNYFSVKNKMPEVLTQRDPLRKVMDRHLRHGYWLMLPKKTPENHRVIIFRIVHPEDLVVLEVMRLGIMMDEYRLFNETSVGDHWVYDMSQAWLQHALQFTPYVGKLYYHITNCYALKMKGFHFVNMPPFALTVLETLKKVMKTKHVKRMHFYKSFEDVYKMLPREIFPKDLGGTADMTCEDLADGLRETLQSDAWRWFFLNQDKNFVSDEAKRIGGPSKGSDIFGMEGSFRKLDLD